MEKSEIQWLYRPAYGKAGDIINLEANYFKVDLDSSVQLYRYHVHVAPEPKTARQRQRAFELFMKEEPCFQNLRDSGVSPVYATDCRSTLVTAEPLELGDSGRNQRQVAYYESEENGPKKIPSVHIHIFTTSVARIQPMPLQKLMDCLTSTTTARPYLGLKGSILQLLNIVVSQKPLEITGVAETKERNKVFTERENEPLGVLGGGLVALQCYSTRLKTASPSLLINFSPRVAIFYREGSLVHLIRDFRASCKATDQLHGFLKGLRVQVPHLKSNNGRPRTKTITGLAILPALGANADQIRFIWEKKEVSVTAYYQRSEYTG